MNFDMLYNILVIAIMLAALFYLLYLLGGDTIVFFRSRQKNVDEKAATKMQAALKRHVVRNGGQLLDNITLYIEGESAHFDYIMVGPFGVVGFQACGRSGDLYGAEKDDTWIQRVSGQRNFFPNPLLEGEKGLRILRTALFRAGIRPKVLDYYTVFTAKKVSVNLPKASPYLLLETMGPDLDKAKYLESNNLDVAQAVKALEAYKV